MIISARELSEQEQKEIKDVNKTHHYYFGIEIKVDEKIYGKDIKYITIKCNDEEIVLDTNIQWGYKGSTPYRFSLLVLMLITQSEILSCKFAKKFLDEVISKYDHIDDFDIDDDTVWEWIADKLIFDNDIKLKEEALKAYKKKYGKDFSNNLNIVKSTCKKLGLTYKELGEAIGYKQDTINKAVSTGKVSEPMRKAIELYLKNTELQRQLKDYEQLKELLKKAVS